jgi:short-subunit dehydrogenase
MRELRGKNALVTGAAGGLGTYISRALAVQGVNLALCDLPSSSTDDLLGELRSRGVGAEVVTADLRETAALEDLVQRTEQAIGPLDILVNNAGVEFGGRFDRQTREELEEIVGVNLLAVMELTRLVLPGMRQRGGGHLVNIASLAGKIPALHLASYSATKHGVVGFTHSLRAEWGDQPVGFSAICPGYVSRVGMYGRLEDEVGEAPFGFETVPPERVGEAVVRAIRDNRAETIVTRRPARPLAILAAAAPGAVTRLVRRPAFVDFAERFARARGRA